MKGASKPTKIKFVSTSSGTAIKTTVGEESTLTPTTVRKRTPSEEILALEIPDGITLPVIPKEDVELATDQYEFYEEESPRKPLPPQEKDEQRKRSQTLPETKNNQWGIEESLRELPEVYTGRNRKRTFNECYDLEGAAKKFQY